MPQRNDLSRSAASLDPDSTLIAVIEMSQSSWLVAAIVPGIERHPLKKLEANEEALLQLLRRWQGEAAGAGRDGFWLARSHKADCACELARKGVEIRPAILVLISRPARWPSDSGYGSRDGRYRISQSVQRAI